MEMGEVATKLILPVAARPARWRPTDVVFLLGERNIPVLVLFARREQQLHQVAQYSGQTLFLDFRRLAGR